MKEVNHSDTWRRALQAEAKDGAKALRQEDAWPAGRSTGPEGHEGGNEFREMTGGLAGGGTTGRTLAFTLREPGSRGKAGSRGSLWGCWERAEGKQRQSRKPVRRPSKQPGEKLHNVDQGGSSRGGEKWKEIWIYFESRDDQKTIFFFFLLHRTACEILAPQPGIEHPCSGSAER